MKITDKMFKDLVCNDCSLNDEGFGKGFDCNHYKMCKKGIESKGYEVEEPKSKLDIAEAITELQELIERKEKQIEKMKCCDNCKHQYDFENTCGDCVYYSKWELKE